MKQPKFYVVWEGHNMGVYTKWDECKRQIDGFEGAKYKSFESFEEAERAFDIGYYQYLKENPRKEKKASPVVSGEYELNAIAVDASCLGNPGVMEYRGVYIASGKELFRVGPYPDGTNNIGEFLAIVHGLALLKQNNSLLTIYSDSVTAMSWVRQKKCKTKLEATAKNGIILDLIVRAEKWLKENHYSNKILKWETKSWGEVPADFGRK